MCCVFVGQPKQSVSCGHRTYHLTCKKSIQVGTASDGVGQGSTRSQIIVYFCYIRIIIIIKFMSSPICGFDIIYKCTYAHVYWYDYIHMYLHSYTTYLLNLNVPFTIFCFTWIRIYSTHIYCLRMLDICVCYRVSLYSLTCVKFVLMSKTRRPP